MNYLFPMLALLATLRTPGQDADPDRDAARLLRQPDVSRAAIVFVYGGDLWLAPRNGGEARRLTANPSIKRYPRFSPDGRQIAFTGNYDGNSDVYVIPAEGGEPKRLTFHPESDDVVGWTPDSKAVLFRSRRNSISRRFTQLFTVPVQGGPEKQLPLPEGGLASFSPDASRIAYNRIDRENATWKRYRGGLQSYISLYDFAKNTYAELPHTEATDFYPMWKDDKIYFASDRSGTVNLYVYTLRSRALKQLTFYTDYDVKWPSLGPDAIVFEQGGALRLMELSSHRVSTVPIRVRSDMALARPAVRKLDSYITGMGVSPSGARAVFAARGKIFTVPAKQGETRNLSNTPGGRDINPAWSPDGKYVAYLSDRSGEYEVYMRPQDGGGEEIRLTDDGSVYRFGPVWSPDSKAVLYTDAAMRIWMVTVAEKRPIRIDASSLGPIPLGSWSPDSQWIAYTRPTANRRSALALYSVKEKKIYPIGDGQFNDRQPVFDGSGKYLYFVSERNFTPFMSQPEININLQNTQGIYALILRADTPSPVAPESDEEPVKDEKEPATGEAAGSEGPASGEAPRPRGDQSGAKSPEPVRIDFEGLYDRTVALPIPPGSYGSLQPGRERLFYLDGSGPGGRRGGGLTPGGAALHVYDLTKRSDVTVMSGILEYSLNPDATKLLYHADGPVYGIVDAPAGGGSGRQAQAGAGGARGRRARPGPTAPPTGQETAAAGPSLTVGAGRLNLDLQAKIDPRAEWTQIYREAWRIERDFYYDPQMRGLDWKAVGDRYARLLPAVAHRDDLTYLLGELLGELNTSHAYVRGVDSAESPQVGVGLLGADFEADQGFFRLKKIYRGENWNEARRSPLTEPGVQVKEGEYLIAVNGRTLRTDTNPYAAFENLAGKTIVLKINGAPAEKGAREVRVRTVASEAGLRYFDWIEGNRRKVEQATGGRAGYVHVPDTSIGGMTEFARGFYASSDKEALIVDERYNSGGFIPDFFVEKLGRKVLSISTPRYGQDNISPAGAVYGPKIILANEWSGSGGDAFPYFFRKYGIGPILGKRTWGGLVGISNTPGLVDGGSVTAPQFGLWSPQDGKWIAENHGVDPDIEVSNTPDLTNQGRDPQLERAISYILEQLKKSPATHQRHPPFPVEKQIPTAKR